MKRLQQFLFPLCLLALLAGALPICAGAEQSRWSVAHVWNESIVSYTPEYLDAFNDASEVLTRELREAYPSRISRVVLVPTSSGYDICVLADPKNAAATEFIDKRITDLPHVRDVLASVCHSPKIAEAEKRPNQALVPTATSVTPAADAPVAPDVAAAHL